VTIDDFARDVMRPLLLAGIKAGSYDNVLAEMLAEHANGTLKMDDEVVNAMVSRAFIVASSPCRSLWDAGDGDRKIGSQLRIRLPVDFQI
jgi:hypothetical protein